MLTIVNPQKIWHHRAKSPMWCIMCTLFSLSSCVFFLKPHICFSYANSRDFFGSDDKSKTSVALLPFFPLKIPPSCPPHPLPSRFVSKIDREPQTEAINWSDPLLYRDPNLVTEAITLLPYPIWLNYDVCYEFTVIPQKKENIVLDLSNCKGKIRTRLQASYWTWRQSMLQHLHEALVPHSCAVVGSFVAEGVNQLCAGSASQ